MVLALAGDSTITRFRDIPAEVPVDYVQKAKPRTMPRLNYMLGGDVSRKTYSPVVNNPDICCSMNGRFTLVKDKIFHASVSQFLTRLAKQNHQNNPLNLLDIDVRSFQRQ